MRIRRLKRKANAWERWHPASRICRGPEQVIRLIGDRVPKTWQDPTGGLGDLIFWQKAGGVRYYANAIPCPECRIAYFKRGALAHHLKEDHHYLLDAVNKLVKKAREEEVEITWRKVRCYYNVAFPRDFLVPPASIEVDISRFIPKGSTPPTGYERERRDKEVLKWRKQMRTHVGEPRVVRLPNGRFQEKSGDIPVWIPQVLIGWKWVPASKDKCMNWADLKVTRRVLSLTLIVPDR